MRRLHAGTKIMATIGPSIHDTEVLASLLEAGMVAGRVDLTWGECQGLAHLLTQPQRSLCPPAAQ